MGRMQREKGKRWERAVTALYQAALGLGKRTGWHQSHGLEVADVSVPLPLASWPRGIWNECKHHRKVPLRAALRQAIGDAPEGHLPIAVCKDDREEPIVLLRLTDWLQLLADQHPKETPDD